MESCKFWFRKSDYFDEFDDFDGFDQFDEFDDFHDWVLFSNTELSILVPKK